jgi:hypothetical protein
MPLQGLSFWPHSFIKIVHEILYVQVSLLMVSLGPVHAIIVWRAFAQSALA